MTRLIITAFLILPFFISAQQSIKTSIHQNWNESTGDWMTRYKTERIFDQYGNEIEVNSSEWVAGRWQLIRKEINACLPNGEKIGSAHYQWKNGEKEEVWNQLPIEVEYDEYGNLIMKTWAMHPDMPILKKHVYEYDEKEPNAKIVAEIHFSLNDQTKKWERHGAIFFSYLKIGGEKKLVKVSQDWIKDRYSYYKYDNIGRLVETGTCKDLNEAGGCNEEVESHIEYLNNGNSKTVYFQRSEEFGFKKHVTIRTANKDLLHKEVYDLAGGEWLLESEIFGYLNKKGQLAKKVFPSCDGTETIIREHFYDNEGRLKNTYYYELPENKTERQPKHRTIYTYLQITGEEAVVEEPFIVYPNPCNSFMSVKPGSFHFQDAVLTVYNVIGKKVKGEEAITADQKIDISFLRSGLYIVQLEIDKKRYVRKIVVSQKSVNP